MYKFNFNCIDNSGKRQNFEIKASDKMQAIKKGMEKAKKHAGGDITTWNCSIKSYF